MVELPGFSPFMVQSQRRERAVAYLVDCAVGLWSDPWGEYYPVEAFLALCAVLWPERNFHVNEEDIDDNGFCCFSDVYDTDTGKSADILYGRPETVRHEAKTHDSR
jgi:hypothetical protein